MPIEYELTPPAQRPAEVLQLDPSQQAVVDHPGGPLLVLAGPGTGKTTTLIEAVVDRIDNRGLTPDQILVLTFSRKAADHLRASIAMRLGRTTSAAPAMTFHSFCYGLVREFADPDSYVDPLRLLSAPEQDAMIKELVDGTDAQSWPAHLHPALRTRGFAGELQTIMARARSLGMDPIDMSAAGKAADRPDWRAAARFFEHYLEVSAQANTIDYSDLVYQALELAADPDIGALLRRRYRLIVVDEYQDTDPLQVQLLQAIAGDGRDLIAVGDPDQSIYAFRGADIGGILKFSTDFATPAGLAPILALESTRRFGPTILAASRDIIGRIGVSGHLDRDAFDRFRNPKSKAATDGTIEVRTFSTAAAESEQLAFMLREAHLRDGIPWGQMAVLVRSGRASLPRLQRAFVAAGVPVEVAGDEVPLAVEPAVRALLTALRLAEALSADHPIGQDQAEAVLTGPLCRLDAGDLRRLGRALRQASTAADETPRPSGELIAASLADPGALRIGGFADGPSGTAAKRAHTLAALLRTAADQIVDRVAPEQVLWTIWAGTDWGSRLRTEFESGGEGSARADHDLDALCALFSLAARAEEQQHRRSVTNFLEELEAQQIPADTLADSGSSGIAVRLMTAHRSKGLEWQLVVVAGVQDGVWPDVRYRGSLLQSDRLQSGGAGQATPTSAALAEERRLFYVACTRATDRLIVTAIESSSPGGDQPSRFLRELQQFCVGKGKPLPPPLPRPDRPLSLRGAITELRTAVETSHSPLIRTKAAEQLARLAQLDRFATRGAHPDRWWGVLDLTHSEQPVTDPEQQLKLSASGVSSIIDCPLSWFLDSKVHGGSATTSAQGFGSIVHALAADVVRERSVDVEALDAQLATVWGQLQFAAPWIGARERTNAHEAISRFAHWHLANTRTPLAAEHVFAVDFEVEGETVVLRGSMDRVELDVDGRLHIIDLKTSKTAPSNKEIAEHPQLGFYQVAIEQGAAADLAPDADSGGAELVQLRSDAGVKAPGMPKVQAQAAPLDNEPFFALDQISSVVRTIRAEEFAATPSAKACQFCSFKRICPAQPEGLTILDGERS